MISNLQEIRVVQPKFDQTKNKTPSRIIIVIQDDDTAQLLMLLTGIRSEAELLTNDTRFTCILIYHCDDY